MKLFGWTALQPPIRGTPVHAIPRRQQQPRSLASTEVICITEARATQHNIFLPGDQRGTAPPEGPHDDDGGSALSTSTSTSCSELFSFSIPAPGFESACGFGLLSHSPASVYFAAMGLGKSTQPFPSHLSMSRERYKSWSTRVPGTISSLNGPPVGQVY